jgi:hypothetical protein
VQSFRFLSSLSRLQISLLDFQRVSLFYFGVIVISVLRVLLIEQSAPLKAAWMLQQQMGVTRTGESRPHPRLLSLLSVPPPRGLLRGVLAGYAM